MEIHQRPDKHAEIKRTFSNWCTRNIPRVSRPCDPTSWRKQVEIPAYFSGNLSGSSQSSRWNAAIGCSLVAIRYFSSMSASSAFSLDFPTTWVEKSVKSYMGRFDWCAPHRSSENPLAFTSLQSLASNWGDRASSLFGHKTRPFKHRKAVSF